MKKTFFKVILALSVFAMIFSCKKSDSPLTKVTPVELDSIASNYYEPVSYTHLDVYKRQPTEVVAIAV